MTAHSNPIRIVALLILVTSMFALNGCRLQQQQTDKPAKNQQASETEADAVGEDVTFTVTQHDHKQWEILAKTARYSEDQASAELEGVSGTFFNDSGKPSLQFTAPKGHYQNQNKQVVLFGGVRVSGVQKENPPKENQAHPSLRQEDPTQQLEAPKLTWSGTADSVLAEGGVKLQKEGFGTSTAQRCRFSMDFSKIDLQGTAETRFQIH